MDQEERKRIAGELNESRKEVITLREKMQAFGLMSNVEETKKLLLPLAESILDDLGVNYEVSEDE